MAFFALSGARAFMAWLSLVARGGQRLGVARDGVYWALHLSGFVVLGALSGQCLRASGRLARRELLAAAGLLAGYGALLEGLQAFVPHRTVDPRDFAANLGGALLGLGAVALRARRAGGDGASPPAAGPQA
ncbi:MAG: VanZ family protein [Planctomycetota bacterium]